MKKFAMKKSLMGFVLAVAMLLAGVQNALAQCAGTVYFKAPSDWTQAVFSGQSMSTPAVVTEKDENGYFSLDLSTLGLGNHVSKFSISNSTTSGMNSYIVTDTVWMHHNPYNASAIQNMATIPCPTSATGKVYVAENVLKPGSTYIGSVPPDAKFFYVLLPEEREWQSDALMISYTKNGVKKDTAMIPSPDYCGWFYTVFDQPPTDAVLYLMHQPDIQLGINGLWDDDGVADPMVFDLVFEAFGADTLFFIPDDAAWPDDVNMGWYVVYPGVEGSCTFTLASIIYDTDKLLNSVFTEDGDMTGVSACVGVHTGIVKTDLGPDGKPQFSGGANAVKCFESAQNFNKLFNYTPGVNETQCYDMPFRHYGTDTRWGFNSDSIHYDDDGNIIAKGGFTGGFYPLENSTDAFVVVINGVPQGPTPAARTKRKAEAPVPLLSEFADFYQYCNTPGWYGGIDCGATNEFNNGDNPAVWDWGNRENWTDVKHNQHFCMQSHATFTYNEDQEFTVTGDDDIWVFINRKLAIDNGGMHLPAPGHVVLKNLNTTYGAGFLVPGNDYDLDIFVCDRRTTMSNLNIKTNMLYIKQSTGLDLTTQQTSSGGLQMNICVETSGGGDCASVALGAAGSSQTVTRECGGDISVPISYSITTRRGEAPAGCADCAELPLGTIRHGGIDLTNPKVPVVYPDKITGLAPGSYRLYIEVNGMKTYYNFRVKGNLGVVSKDVVFDNVDEDMSVYPTGTKWKFVDKAMAGTRIPVYISVPDDQGGVDLIYAQGQKYTLNLSAGAILYRTNDPNSPDYKTPISIPYSGTVDATGIDTLWVEVPLAALEDDQKQVTVTVGRTSAVLTFYSVQLSFATPKKVDESTDRVLEWEMVNQDPDVDENGDEVFHWVNSDVELYLVVTNPSTGAICTECNFTLDIVDASAGISGAVGVLKDGVSLVRIRSSVPYYDEPAFVRVGSIDNPSIYASYGNMHFFSSPMPMPILADIFDARGTQLGDLSIPSEYYDPDAEYLDGRADSLVVVYDRPIASDSIPIFLCLNFDEKNLEKINPYDKGISNNPRDSEMFCSAQFTADDIKNAYARRPNDSTLVFSVNEPFSADVKTHVNMENKIASFAEFVQKGKVVRTFLEKGLTDRMAPIILSARVSAETKGGVYDQMKVVVSEPVSIVTSSYAKNAFSYYLNTATELSEAARYQHVESQSEPKIKKDTLTLYYYNADSHSPTPHLGDFIRFRADKQVWADDVTLSDSALRPKADADYRWNSPTDYNSTERLPSPWVMVEFDSVKVDSVDHGGSENPKDPEDIEFASPSFHIEMTGPFEFKIVMDESLTAKSRSYAIMDLQGRVLRRGVIASGETLVPNLRAGSYVVKVGFGMRRVNIR